MVFKSRESDAMNKRPHFTGLLIILLGLGFVPRLGWAQPFPGEPAPPSLGPVTDDEFRLPLDDATAAGVDQSISLLGSPDYKNREAATTSLIEIGAPAFAKLREAYRQTEELEVRLRIEQVVRTAYLNHYVFDHNGFLGVQLDPLDQNNPKGPRLPGPESGVKIRMVVTQSAAARAELKVGDIIMSMNGITLSGVGQDAVNRFRERIRTTKPGTKVRFEILREMKPKSVDVIMGRANEVSVRTVMFAGVYLQVSERFETWWFKYFRPEASSTTADQP